MNVKISELAVAVLKLHLLEEEKGEPLAFRIVPLTSGCNTPSFALELTERNNQKIVEYQGIPFIDQSEWDWIKDLVIDYNRSTGKLTISHPNPTFLSNCQINQSIGGSDGDKTV